MPDLDPLNPAERETLALLAQGHTAKSIAVLTGRSVASVNERLREARRKTGMGSSRELARLLVAQENQDEQIGVAEAPTADAAPAPEAAPRRASGRFGKALIAMSLLALGGAAALAFALRPAPQTAPAPDPVIANIVGDAELTPPRLHEKLALEKRDNDWASKSEAALRAYYPTIVPLVPGSLRVTCGSSVCEATGLVEAASARRTDRSIRFLQDAPPAADEPRIPGLFGQVSISFGSDPGKEKSVRFLAYWTRER